MRYFPDNLGLATDLLLHREMGTVESRDGYIVVRTPDACDYFFGNMLVLPQRPSVSDRERLNSDFARLIGTPPSIAHRAFSWPEQSGPDVDLAGLAEADDDATVCKVLVARPVDIHMLPARVKLEVRPFAQQRDWDDWFRMQLADMPDPTDPASHRYLTFQQSAYRRLIDRGLGQWWGAFIDGEQVASLGLFFVGSIGRFQSVITAEQHRNRGVCKTLMRAVIERSMGKSEQLVMMADESYHAGSIYLSLGFREAGRVASLCQSMPSAM